MPAGATLITVIELIAEVAIDCPGRDSYSYLVPPGLTLQAGDCVEVDFSGRRMRGFVIETARREPPSGVRMKAVLHRHEGVRLPGHLMGLIRWGARYYRCSLGEFLAGAVPAPVREGVSIEEEVRIQRVADFTGTLTARQRQVYEGLSLVPVPLGEALAGAGCSRGLLERLAAAGAARLERSQEIRELRLESRSEDHVLTQEQERACAAVRTAMDAGEHRTFLLHGITGSGKTLVYLELALAAIRAGRQVLMLLPEIALTPQLAARVRSRIARVAVWHSRFTDGERAALWRAVAGGGYDLVLGTRSALFAPLPAPGLIIVDEEHEQSYKQESVPRYHARDLAVVYGGQIRVPVLLGSATPSLESVYNARQGRYAALSLRERPLGGSLPTPVVVDMRAEFQRAHARAEVAGELIERLTSCQKRGEQAIVLLNRRGWSPVVSCRACGEALHCHQCAITLTFHRADQVLRCHFCGHQTRMPPACPACQACELTTEGIGTEQLAHALALAVPALRILRVDADTVARRQGHAELFQQFASGSADCLVGTQMVAKGLDFPRVTLVGVVAADRGLAVPDFRAAERTYQLLAQVSGRAGRGERPGTVVVQAFDTQALALRCALENRPREFIDAELDLRRSYGYPPYAGLVRVLWSGPSLAAVAEVAASHGERLQAVRAGAVVLGPNPAQLELLKGQFRWHALVKAASRGAAQALLDRLEAAGGLPSRRGVRVSIDVDPYHIA